MNSEKYLIFLFLLKIEKNFNILSTICNSRKGFEITSNFKHIKPLFIINLDETTIKNIIDYFELLDFLKKTLKIKKYLYI